jgi:hypothetical protein
MTDDGGREVNTRKSMMTLLIIAGVIAIVAGVVSPYVTAQSAADHESTSGTVISSDVLTTETLEDGETVYKNYPVVEYEYTVDGERYTNDRIYLSRGTCSPGGEICGTREYDRSTSAERFLEDYPEGEDVTVYYDSGNPGGSSTTHIVDASTFPTLSNLFWALVGSIALVLGIAGRRGARVERLIPFWNP